MSKFINLEDDDNVTQPTIEKEDKPASGPAGLTVQSGKSLDDVFDKYMKLVYLFDVSGSMYEGIPSDTIDKMYVWTPEILAEFRSRLIKEATESTNFKYNLERAKQVLKEQAIEEMREESDDEDSEEEKSSDEPSDSVIEELAINLHAGFEVNSDHYLKLAIHSDLKNRAAFRDINLMKLFVEADTKTKLVAMKDAAVEFVTKRFNKYPEADVVVFKFDDHPTKIAESVPKGPTLAAIQAMGGGGGTDIYTAMARGVQTCKKMQSPVKAHHIVLVTDGEDFSARNVPQLLPEMKKLNIVVDFIYMKSIAAEQADLISMLFGTRQERANANIEALIKVSKETGGEFVTVTNAAEFKEKFLAASSRLCLPPASNQ